MLMVAAANVVAADPAAIAKAAESNARRVLEAHAVFDRARREAPPETVVAVLVSFSVRLTPAEVARYLERCECTVYQGYVSVDEVKWAIGLDRELLARPDSEMFLAREFVEKQIPLAPWENEDPSSLPEPTRSFEVARKVAIESVMAKARSGHLALDGILLKGPFSEMVRLRDRMGSHVLAMEFVARQIPFAIPLDLYRPTAAPR